MPIVSDNYTSNFDVNYCLSKKLISDCFTLRYDKIIEEIFIESKKQNKLT